MTQTFHIKASEDQVLKHYREAFTTATLLEIMRVHKNSEPFFQMAYNCACQVIIERQEEMS